MPKVRFVRTAIVRDVRYTPGREVELDDAAAADVVASEVGVIVGASEVRTAVDHAPAVARKAVRLEP